MPYFRCGGCNAVYWDYYPPDDTCLKCKRGLISIIEQPDLHESGFFISKEEDQ